MVKPKIPLGDMLSAIDRNDFDFYSRLSDELKEVFEPWLAMRFASHVSGVREVAFCYLMDVNNNVNTNFSVLSPRKNDDYPGHPELQWKLLATCGLGKKRNHFPLINPPKKRKKNKLETLLMDRYPTLNKNELELLMEINDTNSLKELAQDTGLSNKDIKELFK